VTFVLLCCEHKELATLRRTNLTWIILRDLFRTAQWTHCTLVIKTNQ